jgi:hypothetical protein
MYNMYFAQMYHFGFHNDCAGITGIRSCMGIIFVGDRPIYAGHLPSNRDVVNKGGADAVAAMIVRTESKPSRGRLFMITNGKERTSARSEAVYLRGLLGNPATTLYIIGSKHLGMYGDSPKSAAVRVRHGINKLIKEYKHIPEPGGWEGAGPTLHQTALGLTWL